MCSSPVIRRLSLATLPPSSSSMAYRHSPPAQTVTLDPVKYLRKYLTSYFTTTTTVTGPFHRASSPLEDGLQFIFFTATVVCCRWVYVTYNHVPTCSSRQFNEWLDRDSLGPDESNDAAAPKSRLKSSSHSGLSRCSRGSIDLPLHRIVFVESVPGVLPEWGRRSSSSVPTIIHSGDLLYPIRFDLRQTTEDAPQLMKTKNNKKRQQQQQRRYC